ncbi:MAG: chemotaxis protein CheY [Pseudomonadota bacterium]|jgi:two-component system response regulator FixJ
MNAKIAVVEDDPAVLDAVSALLNSKGHAVLEHNGARSLLDAGPDGGCIISDVRMPEMNGLELVDALKSANDPRPIILISGHGDIEMAMQAVKSGAFDFIEKPFDDERLLGAVEKALDAYEQVAAEQAEVAELRERFDSLTQRQKETMQLLVEGMTNKDIAQQLGISPRTVEIYRAWVLSKMRADSLVDLVKMSMRLNGNSNGAG